MTVEELREKGWIILEVIGGSWAYGTAIEGKSDIDIRGIFIQPTEEVLMANPYIPQISDIKNDIIFYEIGRFIELLEKGNPNILELLNIPEDCIIYKDPIFKHYFNSREPYITKQLQYTFVGYAKTQISKAKGKNKKLDNPKPKKMMHGVRVIETIHDIINKKEIVVRRENRKYLLSIRNGEISYEEIMQYVQSKIDELPLMFKESTLREKVDTTLTREILLNIRIENLNK